VCVDLFAEFRGWGAGSALSKMIAAYSIDVKMFKNYSKTLQRYET